MISLQLNGVGKVSGQDSPHHQNWEKIVGTPNIKWVMDGPRVVPQTLGKKMTVGQLVSAVTGHLGTGFMSSSDIQAVVLALLDHTWSAEECEMVIDHPIPDSVKEVLHHWVRWTVIGGSERRLLVRTQDDLNTWELTGDPWATLANTKHPKGGTVLDYISKKVEAMQLSGETTWGVETTCDKHTGKTSKTITPFLTLADETPDATLKDHRFFIPEPRVFSNDLDVHCYSYFPLDKEREDTKNPEHWLDFESQFPSWGVRAWRAAFYGIFYAGNRSRQIIYLYDNGRTGKSNMVRAITKNVSPGFYAPVSKDSFSNQFWGSKIYGRRLIVYSDSGNTKISQMDKVKQLSGGDPIDVEFKGLNARIQYTPNSRVIVTTNRRPEINLDEVNQTSRALVFPLTATTDPAILKKFCAVDEDGELILDEEGNPQPIGADYDKHMAEEFYDYLALCEDAYFELCPNDQDILVPAEMKAYISGSCATAANDAVSAITQIYLQVTTNDEDVMTNADLREIVTHVCGTSSYRDSDLTFETFCDALKIRGATRAQPFRRKGAVHRGWARVKLRPGVHVTPSGIKIEEVEDSDTQENLT